MTLGVITRRGPKQQSIFEKFLPFVDKLVGQYKQSQQNKWDSEWMLSALQDIEVAGNKEDIDAYIFKKDPPEELLDVKGMTDFAGEAMGLLMQKEIMTGGLTPTVTPKGVEEPSAVELVPDVKEFNELYKFVSGLPTGEVDWTNTLDIFKQRLEKNRAMGSAAQQFLNMIMGQQPTDQRAKFGQDYELAKDIKETLYPEEEEVKPGSELEYWLREHPGQGVEEYWKAKYPEEEEVFDDKAFLKANPNMELKSVSSTGHRSYGLKTEEKPLFDFEGFLKENPDWEIKTISSTGNVSVGKKDTTKKWEFDTWEEAQAWAKAHPQEGYEWKIETQGEGFNVTAMKKTTTPEGETKKIIPTYGVIQTINQDLTDPKKDYKKTLAQAGVKYDLSDPNIELITEPEKWTSIYDKTISRIKSFIDDEGKISEGEFKGYSYEMLYKQAYVDLQKAVEEYQKVTSQTLQNPFLSFEEYEKSDVKPGKGLFHPSTWGQQKSVFSNEVVSNRTLEFVKEMLDRGGRLDDYNSEELKKLGVDIEEAKRLINQMR